jgi:uncharacterized protein DUF3105
VTPRRAGRRSCGLITGARSADPSGMEVDPRKAKLSPRAAFLSAAVTLLFVATLAVLAFVPGKGRATAAVESSSLHALALKNGCRLIEVDTPRKTNPPTTGKFRESERTADRDYTRSRTPPLRATVHALLHGRILFQYQPGLERPAITALRALYTESPSKVLLFRNKTRMPYEVAATAYLSALVCPHFSADAVSALRAFRDRRRAFAQLP